MKQEVTQILEAAKRAPSVLNSQPWRFRVCGNTIEIYFERQQSLAEVDPFDRLQMASCGSLIAYVTSAIIQRGWTPKIDYFPRFEEENLVAYIEIKEKSRKKESSRSNTERIDESPANLSNGLTPGASKPERDHIQDADKSAEDSAVELQKEIKNIAARHDVDLFMHDDSIDRHLQTYFEEKCGRNLEEKSFQKNVNMYFRSQDIHSGQSRFEDEVLLSDNFFNTNQLAESGFESTDDQNVRFLILVTGTDNRYAWIRAGEVLAESLLHLKKKDGFGLIALPIITKEACCRDWLRKELKIKGFPQFVLKMGHLEQVEHYRKRPLQELLKYGF